MSITSTACFFWFFVSMLLIICCFCLLFVVGVFAMMSNENVFLSIQPPDFSGFSRFPFGMSMVLVYGLFVDVFLSVLLCFGV